MSFIRMRLKDYILDFFKGNSFIETLIVLFHKRFGMEYNILDRATRLDLFLFYIYVGEVTHYFI